MTLALSFSLCSVKSLLVEPSSRRSPTPSTCSARCELKVSPRNAAHCSPSLCSKAQEPWNSLHNTSQKLSPLSGFKDDKNAALQRGSVATCGLKTEGNTPSIICFRDSGHSQAKQKKHVKCNISFFPVVFSLH